MGGMRFETGKGLHIDAQALLKQKVEPIARITIGITGSIGQHSLDLVEWCAEGNRALKAEQIGVAKAKNKAGGSQALFKTIWIGIGKNPKQGQQIINPENRTGDL
jgi:hypothetical protein